jgi:hypothetical protein
MSDQRRRRLRPSKRGAVVVGTLLRHPHRSARGPGRRLGFRHARTVEPAKGPGARPRHRTRQADRRRAPLSAPCPARSADPARTRCLRRHACAATGGIARHSAGAGRPRPGHPRNRTARRPHRPAGRRRACRTQRTRHCRRPRQLRHRPRPGGGAAPRQGAGRSRAARCLGVRRRRLGLCRRGVAALRRAATQLSVVGARGLGLHGRRMRRLAKTAKCWRG